MCGRVAKTWQGLSKHVRAAHRLDIYTYMSFNLDQLQLRILQNVVKRLPPEGRLHLGECWVWQGREARSRRRNTPGYGSIRLAGSPTEAAHRVSYWAFTGALLENGVLVLHQCDRTMCVNPRHMRPGTHEENMEERCERDRTLRGANIHTTELTEEQVKRIRQHASWGWNNGDIGRKFDITTQTARRIVSGETWSHVPYDPAYDGDYIPF